jgi:integrase
MSVHKTKNGNWFVNYYLPGERKTAKRKYFGHGRESELTARQWDLELSQAKKDNQIVPIDQTGTGLTFLELAQRYLDQHPLSSKTRYTILTSINKHVADLFGRISVDRLNMSHLADLDAALVKNGLTLSTRNRYRSYCRAICEWGVNNDLVESNPFSRFRPDVKREQKAPDPPTNSEIQQIWNHAPEHLRWALYSLLNLGVRPGVTELFRIRMSDVDFEHGGVWVTRTKTHSKRTLLPVLPEFLEAVRKQLTQDPDRDYLIEYKGRPVKTLKTTWGTTLRRAGIERRLRLYDFRHYYATSILSDGADMKATSQLLGHSSPGITMKVYYHLKEHQQREAINHLQLPDLKP